MTGYIDLASQEATYWHKRADKLRTERQALVAAAADERTIFLKDKAIEAADGVAKWYATHGEKWMRENTKP